MIPVCDLLPQYLALKTEIDAAMQAVAKAGHFILGPNVKALEAEVAAYCGCAYAVGVNSGTDALHLALRALRVGPGDEVITTPFTFIATTEAIGMVGATPVFVDIDPDTFNMDPARLEAAITRHTKAILPVHLYGQPCAMDEILAVAHAHGLYVVEDCAQAMGSSYHGRKVGTLSDVGCLSFFPSKNLGCYGDGGMLITDNPEVAERAEMLRRHGGKVKYHHSELGLNSRLDELQAAILRVKLPHLDTWLAARRAHAYRYNALLAAAGIATPRERLGEHVIRPTAALNFPLDRLYATYHQYTVCVAERDRVQRELAAAGVGTMVYYPVPLHRQAVHAGLGHAPGDFPAAEAAAASCLSLPIFPELQFAQQERVVEALTATVAGLKAA